ncbi:ABC transporter substrate-binding protein [Halorussus sp. AFM4]|uniref:ABC transporter substrate-binding protein n=1 Tax=Halorussus sp. AFM4 TaxID=3421651 RepID=UPI003EB8006F
MTDNIVDRRQVLRGVGAAGIASIAGCTGGGGGGSDLPSGKLNLAQAKSPVDLDPIVSNDVPSAEVIDRVFDTLYNYNEDASKVVPILAKGQPETSKNGKRYTVSLKKNAKFHNGDPVTATDVKYSFEAPVKEETENAAEFSMIKSITAVDEHTVQFDLKYPYGAFMDTLVWYVVPKSVREKNKDKFNKKKPVGAGPFKFVDWKEGNYVDLERWGDYWGKPKPNLSKVHMTPVTEPTTRVTTLQNGENDVVKGIPPKMWSTVKNMGNASIESTPGMGYFYLAFNCKKGPTADPKVREAIDYAFSMDQAVKNYVEPVGIRQYAPVPEAVSSAWNFPVDEWKQIPHDKNIDKAKQMLDSNDNVPSDWSPTIIVPPDEKRKQIGITVGNALKEAGYPTNVQQLDWAGFLEKYKTGNPDDYNMYTLGWSGSPDPDGFLYYFFAEPSHGVTDGTFYSKVSDQVIDARKTANHEKRKRLYEEAITTLLEDRAHIPAYNLKNNFGVRNTVKDFRAHSVNQFTLATDYNNVKVNK